MQETKYLVFFSNFVFYLFWVVLVDLSKILIDAQREIRRGSGRRTFGALGKKFSYVLYFLQFILYIFTIYILAHKRSKFWNQQRFIESYIEQTIYTERGVLLYVQNEGFCNPSK